MAAAQKTQRDVPSKHVGMDQQLLATVHQFMSLRKSPATTYNHKKYQTTMNQDDQQPLSDTNRDYPSVTIIIQHCPSFSINNH